METNKVSITEYIFRVFIAGLSRVEREDKKSECKDTDFFANMQISAAFFV